MSRRGLTYRELPVPADMSYTALVGACEIFEKQVGLAPTYVYLGRQASEDYIRAKGYQLGMHEQYMPSFEPDEWAVGNGDGPVYGCKGV